MHVAVKRSIVAAAAVAAAGLYGSLSYDGAVVAQQGVPTVHRDVALVDVDVDDTAIAAATPAATFLLAENVFNDQAYDAFFGVGANSTSDGTGGLENAIYTAAGSHASVLLDTYGVSGALPTTLPVDQGADFIFNGATSQYIDGVYADGLLGEDYLNQALGISASASEASILAQLEGIAPDPFVDPTTGAASETTQIAALETAGLTSAQFDGDLAGLAQAFYTQSFTDLSGYETYLSDNATLLTSDDFSLSSILGDVSTALTTSVSGLSTELSTFITALDTFAGI